MQKKESVNSWTELTEKLAKLEHDQWIHWHKYFLSQCVRHEQALDGAFKILTLPTKPYDRWLRQMRTPYAGLSVEEKESERKWARKVIDTIAQCEFLMKPEIVRLIKGKTINECYTDCHFSKGTGICKKEKVAMDPSAKCMQYIPEDAWGG